MIVEFVGLPASGKSFLAQEVKARVQSDWGADEPAPSITTSSEKRTRSRLPFIAGALFSHVVRYPLRTSEAIYHLYRRQVPTARKFLRYASYQLYVCEELRRARRGNELHLADQGYLQQVWLVHLMGAASTPADIDRHLDLYHPWLAPDIVVWVEVDQQTRMQRGQARGNAIDPAFFDPEHPAIKRDVASYRELKAVVRERAADSAVDIQFERIENTTDAIDDNVAHLSSIILERWHEQ